jgi:Ca-activated chloride channel homolog
MTFEWPILLLGLALVPIVLLLYLLAQRRRRAYAVRFTNLALLGQVMGRGPGWRRHLPPLLFLLGITALLISLARPYTVIAVPRDQAAIMLVMDVSGSMVANDLRPDRMQAAKTAARSFVAALPPNQMIGLVSFNATASTAAPLTLDHALVGRAIDGLNANGGTAIGEGLNLALDQLALRPVNAAGERAPALVVLLSDGASSAGRSAEQVAQRARDEGIVVHTVGIGQRGAEPRINGRLPARLDETTLQAVAAATGGEYFYAAETPQLEQVYTSLGSQISWVEERTEVTALVSALGTFIVMAGALLSLGWFQKLP